MAQQKKKPENKKTISWGSSPKAYKNQTFLFPEQRTTISGTKGKKLTHPAATCGIKNKNQSSQRKNTLLEIPCRHKKNEAHTYLKQGLSTEKDYKVQYAVGRNR
ncbi:MAG: hypothetical protein HQL19_08495 [Candidatus Omnitrophica bacterium]|nr:hypothetical protein [Candidatus Omnitrophota bacterium]